MKWHKTRYSSGYTLFVKTQTIFRNRYTSKFGNVDLWSLHIYIQQKCQTFTCRLFIFRRAISFIKFYLLPQYASVFVNDTKKHTLERKKKGKYQESIQSSTTPDPGYQWESNNFTIRHHKREPIGQPFPSR